MKGWYPQPSGRGGTTHPIAPEWRLIGIGHYAFELLVRLSSVLHVATKSFISSLQSANNEAASASVRILSAARSSSQYSVSAASFFAIDNFARKSALLCAYSPSFTFAPILVLHFKICLRISTGILRETNARLSLKPRTEKRKLLSLSALSFFIFNL